MSIFLSLLLICLILLLVTPFGLCWYDNHNGTSYSCKYWGWHNGKGETVGVKFDGCSIHASCSKCGKEVMQDSQGNWF
jgi:hypothetical protein